MSGLRMGRRSIRTGAAKRRAAAEALERRVLLSGSLSGTAWNDVDGDGVRDEAEAALPGVRVYLDADNDAAFDATELSVTTDAQGGYELTGVPAGRQLVRQVVPSDRAPTFPGQAGPVVTRTIEGIDFNENAQVSGFFFIPARPSGGVGPAHVVSTVRSSIEWHTKSGAQQNSQSLVSFFAPVGGQNAGAPKVFYDRDAGRFVVVVLDRPFNRTTPGFTRILFAVSDDDNPNGAWHFAAIDSQVSIDGVVCAVDSINVGLDRDAIYVSGMMVDTTIFQGSRLWVVAKDPLYGGGDPVVSLHDPAAEAGLPRRQIIQPAQVFGDGAPGAGNYLLTTDLGSDDLDVIRVTNPLTGPTFTSQKISMGDVGDVPEGGLLFKYPGAPQLGSQTVINTGSGWVTSAVWRGGALYAAMSVLPKSGPDAGQVTVHWVKIDTSDPANLRLADQGNVGGEELGAGTFTFLPAVAVDGQGNMAINFAASGPSIYAGGYFTSRRADDPAGTVRPVATVAAGQDYYVRTFGGLINWWGHSWAAVDPSDDSTFWAFNQYAITRGNFDSGEDGRWGTRWRAFTLPGATPGAHRVDLADGQAVPDLHFGSRRTAGTIFGSVFHDLDGDGTRDEGEPGLAGRTAYLDRNNNGVADGSTTATQTVFGREWIPSGPMSDYDGGGVLGRHAFYVVSAVPGTITDLNVRLSITHPRISDMEVRLVNQNGTRVPLVSRVGGTGANFNSTQLDDEAVIAVEDGSAPFNGSFRPQSPLSAFDGLPAAGTWRLEVDDMEAGEVGTITAWSLIFTTTRPGETTAVTAEGGTYSFPGLPLGNHTVRQVLPEGWEQSAPAAAHGVALTAAAADATGRDFGSRPVQPPPAAVYVRGSSWTQGFKAYLESQGLGDDVYGYRVDDVTGDQRILSWVNLNEIVLRYAAPPSGAGIPTPGTVTLTGDRPGGDYAVTAVNQLDPQTFAVVLDRPLGHLSTGGENGVRVSLSVAGATFRIDTLQGDVDRSGSVVAADFSDVKNRFFRTTAAPGPAGPQQYTVFHDVDGSGGILANDFSLVKARFFDSLPAAPAPAGRQDRPSLTGELFAAAPVID